MPKTNRRKVRDESQKGRTEIKSKIWERENERGVL
jgi:hypothetical protein